MDHATWIKLRADSERNMHAKLVVSQLATIEEAMKMGHDSCHLWTRLTEEAYESLLARKFAFSEAEQPLGGWKVTWW